MNFCKSSLKWNHMLSITLTSGSCGCFVMVTELTKTSWWFSLYFISVVITQQFILYWWPITNFWKKVLEVTNERGMGNNESHAFTDASVSGWQLIPVEGGWLVIWICLLHWLACFRIETANAVFSKLSTMLSYIIIIITFVNKDFPKKIHSINSRTLIVKKRKR